MLDFVNGDALRARCRSRAARHAAPGRWETELGGLAQNAPRAGLPTDLAAHPISPNTTMSAALLVGQRSHQAERRRDRPPARRAEPTGDIEIDVVGADCDAAARLEHATPWPIRWNPSLPPHAGCVRGQEGDTSAWISVSTGRVPSIPRNTQVPETWPRRSPRTAPRGWRLLTGRVGHLEHADLLVGPKRCLHRAQDAEVGARAPLEIEHRVDHVLEHAGPRWRRPW